MPEVLGGEDTNAMSGLCGGGGGLGAGRTNAGRSRGLECEVRSGLDDACVRLRLVRSGRVRSGRVRCGRLGAESW